MRILSMLSIHTYARRLSGACAYDAELKAERRQEECLASKSLALNHTKTPKNPTIRAIFPPSITATSIPSTTTDLS